MAVPASSCVKQDDQNLSSLVETFRSFIDEPLMVQRYLPEIKPATNGSS